MYKRNKNFLDISHSSFSVTEQKHHRSQHLLVQSELDTADMVENKDGQSVKHALTASLLGFKLSSVIVWLMFLTTQCK